MGNGLRRKNPIMKSNVCKVKGNDEDLKMVLSEVEKAASYNGLEKKKTLQLMLLAEELIGIQKGILGFVKGDFYVESNDDEYKLCLHADIHTDVITQERFIEMSTNNKNEATKGILGKIKYVANCLASGNVPTTPEQSIFYMPLGSSNLGTDVTYDNVWSLGNYRSTVEKGTSVWDELEHSIVANIADDLLVGATANYIDLIAVKMF